MAVATLESHAHNEGHCTGSKAAYTRLLRGPARVLGACPMQSGALNSLASSKPGTLHRLEGPGVLSPHWSALPPLPSTATTSVVARLAALRPPSV